MIIVDNPERLANYRIIGPEQNALKISCLGRRGKGWLAMNVCPVFRRIKKFRLKKLAHAKMPAALAEVSWMQ